MNSFYFIIYILFFILKFSFVYSSDKNNNCEGDKVIDFMARKNAKEQKTFLSSKTLTLPEGESEVIVRFRNEYGNAAAFYNNELSPHRTQETVVKELNSQSMIVSILDGGDENPQNILQTFQTFFETNNTFTNDLLKALYQKVKGSASAITAYFEQDKVLIAHKGKSRAIVYKNKEMFPDEELFLSGPLAERTGPLVTPNRFEINLHEPRLTFERQWSSTPHSSAQNVEISPWIELDIGETVLIASNELFEELSETEMDAIINKLQGAVLTVKFLGDAVLDKKSDPLAKNKKDFSIFIYQNTH